MKALALAILAAMMLAGCQTIDGALKDTKEAYNKVTAPSTETLAVQEKAWMVIPIPEKPLARRDAGMAAVIDDIAKGIAKQQSNVLIGITAHTIDDADYLAKTLMDKLKTKARTIKLKIKLYADAAKAPEMRLYRDGVEIPANTI